MDWLAQALAKLAGLTTWGYAPAQPSASEPAAVTAVALSVAGKYAAARPALDWLKTLQAKDGSIGIRAAEPEPRWPTSWAIAAWTLHDRLTGTTTYKTAIEGAIGWMLQMAGETMEQNPDFGHDSTLAGWPWVLHTHSWQEPTALAVMALQSAGYADHPRVSEGAKLLTDRLLETGGCNYGNTVVLGQSLRAHVQPTGLTLLALRGHRDKIGKLQRSIGWLARSIGPGTTPASLAYALLGLAAHDHLPADADQWLRAAIERELSRPPRPYVLALLALAAQHDRVKRTLKSDNRHG